MSSRAFKHSIASQCRVSTYLRQALSCVRTHPVTFRFSLASCRRLSQAVKPAALSLSTLERCEPAPYPRIKLNSLAANSRHNLGLRMRSLPLQGWQRCVCFPRSSHHAQHIARASSAAPKAVSAASSTGSRAEAATLEQPTRSSDTARSFTPRQRIRSIKVSSQ